jgi:uncharacterized protein YbjT (DUF2867 family)
METILVTGANGSLGKATVAALVNRGFKVRAASRNPQQSTNHAVHPIRFDYTDPNTHKPALEGVDGVVLIAPPLDVLAADKLNPFIDQASAIDLGHVVLNSALGVDANEDAPLRKIERHLMASGVNYTILRPNFFMENFTSGFLGPMVHQGEIYLAAAAGKTSFISTFDIAAVAAESFAAKRYGCEFNLTGPEALDHTAIAQLISLQSGRTVTYHAISIEDMIQGAIQNGLPESSAQYMGILYNIVSNGWAEGVTDDVQKVICRPPLSFATFAQQNANAWQ